MDHNTKLSGSAIQSSGLSGVIVTATVGHAETERCIASWGTGWPVVSIGGADPMLAKYQAGYEQTSQDIIAFIHDDVLIHDQDWHARVLAEFADPAVGLVGFGGALRHGSPDLYKRPFRLTDLGRTGYLSNVDDAEVHGGRFDGACDVAVLDGFALIARRAALAGFGGWSAVPTGVGYSCYDYALCCLMRRHGWRVRIVGVRCQHLGGMTAVGLKLADSTDGIEHVIAHRAIWCEFPDVLPACTSHTHQALAVPDRPWRIGMTPTPVD